MDVEENKHDCASPRVTRDRGSLRADLNKQRAGHAQPFRNMASEWVIQYKAAGLVNIWQWLYWCKQLLLQQGSEMAEMRLDLVLAKKRNDRE